MTTNPNTIIEKKKEFREKFTSIEEDSSTRMMSKYLEASKVEAYLDELIALVQSSERTKTETDMKNHLVLCGLHNQWPNPGTECHVAWFLPGNPGESKGDA